MLLCWCALLVFCHGAPHLCFVLVRLVGIAQPACCLWWACLPLPCIHAAYGGPACLGAYAAHAILVRLRCVLPPPASWPAACVWVGLFARVYGNSCLFAPYMATLVRLRICQLVCARANLFAHGQLVCACGNLFAHVATCLRMLQHVCARGNLFAHVATCLRTWQLVCACGNLFAHVATLTLLRVEIN